MEHFGSTAIPRLSAKPIIDIMVILDDLAAWPALIPTLLAGLGYVYWAENPRADRMFFVEGNAAAWQSLAHASRSRYPEDRGHKG